MKDYYSILKISRSASSIEIKTSYRNLSKQFHPDVNKAPNASSIFIEIKEAYEVLIDDARRIHYNQLLDYAIHQQNKQINSTPKISVFYCDNAEFSVGDVVTFTWEVSDADVVELRPFGKVANSGTKKIRIIEVSTNLLVELFCYNSISKNYVFSQIILKKRESFQNTTFQNHSNEFYYENIQDEKETYFQNLIRNNPHINPKHFEKEKFNDVYGRIDAPTFTRRVLVLTAIYLVLMYFFVPITFDYPFILIFVNFAYYLTLYKQSIKRFHDFNSKGKFAFISLIPFISWFQCIYLSTKEGDSVMNDFGLPAEALSENQEVSFSKKFDLKSLSRLTKLTLGTAVLNIILIVFFSLNPKHEIPFYANDIYGKEISNYKGNGSYTQMYIRANGNQYIISDEIGEVLKANRYDLVYLGINTFTDNLSYVRVDNASQNQKYYMPSKNLNGGVLIFYFVFLAFQFYTFFFMDKVKHEDKYEGLLGFIMILNLAYLYIIVS
ncbi:DUF805 domain-containing protein [Paenimyroides tangerinum]|uniref:DUF805 domain-containing protein n=1 Tax=Paenimyroides tangerinum TaxID=2488728 RepID=A0A3P3VXA3_9FLAO|nr:DUF805 domain-containing protein [Paenimyroides tangerinum]RRJ87415.1 DUF805 domain-containing protein [Paenimyroides tangerinum]